MFSSFQNPTERGITPESYPTIGTPASHVIPNLIYSLGGNHMTFSRFDGPIYSQIQAPISEAHELVNAHDVWEMEFRVQKTIDTTADSNALFSFLIDPLEGDGCTPKVIQRVINAISPPNGILLRRSNIGFSEPWLYLSDNSYSISDFPLQGAEKGELGELENIYFDSAEVIATIPDLYSISVCHSLSLSDAQMYCVQGFVSDGRAILGTNLPHIPLQTPL